MTIHVDRFKELFAELISGDNAIPIDAAVDAAAAMMEYEMFVADNQESPAQSVVTQDDDSMILPFVPKGNFKSALPPLPKGGTPIYPLNILDPNDEGPSAA